MSRRRAPIAMRMPISRVRSVTDTSMMFMMPMPPTSSEMEAMAPSMQRHDARWSAAAASATAVRLRTVKSLSAPSLDAVALAQQLRDVVFRCGHGFR